MGLPGRAPGSLAPSWPLAATPVREGRGLVVSTSCNVLALSSGRWSPPELPMGRRRWPGAQASKTCAPRAPGCGVGPLRRPRWETGAPRYAGVGHGHGSTGPSVPGGSSRPLDQASRRRLPTTEPLTCRPAPSTSQQRPYSRIPCKLWLLRPCCQEGGVRPVSEGHGGLTQG